MTSPYKIVGATLVTYSGKRCTLSIETEVLTIPVWKAKERLLDGLKKCRCSVTDPYVSIEVKVRKMFNNQ
jgi:hypothetical protein